jgi:4-hydroxy 2-oxovalerate aldolase
MIEILECTLRDASYPISYQFTTEDTALLCRGLYNSGFSRIEIGHGLGLGASGKKYGFAAATDEAYAAAAAAALPNGYFGFFAIPGIANLKSIDIISKYKGGFVRIGTDVKDTSNAESYIKYAKDLGLEVSSNLMKTYSASVNEVVDRSMQLQEWGADIISVVDSAGGMLGDSVAEYISEMVKAGVYKVGFHGHNNLQLAVSNSIIAINNGAKIVDSTLRGMGRSSGNAQTEALVLCLERMGHKTGIDIISMLNISEKIIGPICKGRGSDNIEVVSGFSLFHSGYQNLVEKVALQENIDVRKLIIETGDGKGEIVNEDNVINIAKDIAKEEPQKININKFKVEEFSQNLNFKTSHTNSVLDVANELSSWSNKTGNTSIFTISKGNPILIKNHFIRISNGMVISNIEIENDDLLKEIIENVYNIVDFICIDEKLCQNISNFKQKDKLITFSESNAMVLALDAFINQIDKENVFKNFGVVGINSSSIQLLQILAKQNKSIFIDGNNKDIEKLLISQRNLFSLIPELSNSTLERIAKNNNIDILVAFEMNENVIFEILEQNIESIKFVIDASLFSFSDKIIQFLKKNNIEIYRLDMRAALLSEVQLRLETKRMVDDVCGKSIIDDVSVVAGGLIGLKGDIIIDSIHNPRKIIGVADGLGGIMSELEQKLYYKNIDIIRNYIFNKNLNS